MKTKKRWVVILKLEMGAYNKKTDADRALNQFVLMFKNRTMLSGKNVDKYSFELYKGD